MIVKIRVRRPFAPKRHHRRSGRAAAIALILALLGTLWILVGDGGVVEVLRLRERADQMRQEIARAEQANRETADEVRALLDDPEAVERLAREELYLARPDETIYLLPRASTEDAEPGGGQKHPPDPPDVPTPQNRR